MIKNKILGTTILTLCACAIFNCAAANTAESFKQAIALRDTGEFSNAVNQLQSTLEQTSNTMTDQEKTQFKFEIERIARIRQDYTLSRDEVITKMQEKVPDFKAEELDAHECNGELDTMTIDGTKRYVNATPSNLLRRNISLRKRCVSNNTEFYKPLLDAAQQAMEARKTTKNTLILPYDMLVTYTLTVKGDTKTSGQLLEVWLPAPRMQPNQSDFILLETSDPNAILSQPESHHRTIYMTDTAKEGPTTFTATYAFRSWTRAFEPDPKDVEPYDKNSAIYKQYTAAQLPHIDLNSEYLKSLNHEIVGEETNPLLIAKRIHNWIGDHLIYQYAREYSTLDNISEYVAKRRAGDCGQHAMFFIAMCRLNGVPARWSTGWVIDLPKHKAGLHDWAEIYVEPWGWMPVDTDIALLVKNNSDDALTTDQKQVLSDWLFCNQDPYRMTVNNDFSQPLQPRKDDFRSETVDFQRGEVECNDVNLYFDKWDYHMDVQPLKPGELERMIKPIKY